MTEDFKSKVDKMMATPKLNARKSKGASDAVTRQLLIAGLYKHGIITVVEGVTVVDMSDIIEETWGENDNPTPTTENIRTVLKQLIAGLKKTGSEYTVINKGEKNGID